MRIIDNFGREQVDALQGYLHTQINPSSQWTVPHKLGYRPNTVMVYINNRWTLADVTHIDNDTLMIDFRANQTGLAKVI